MSQYLMDRIRNPAATIGAVARFVTTLVSMAERL
jgi:hypothetical protein